MDVINDMSTSGSLDDAEEVSHQFSDHFQKTTAGGSGPKWVARFCKAYVAHGMSRPLDHFFFERLYLTTYRC